jgi:branched-chain amino acid transport system ATP-binding protein
MTAVARLLEVENLEVVYHRAITAVQGVSFSVNENAITALVGTNGAGKTTTLTAISGFMRVEDAKITEGEIRFCGERVNRRYTDQISRLGIAHVPERDKIFPTLTVRENLIACRTCTKADDFDIADAFELFPRLAERASSVSGYLSGGERQMLAIALALVTQPRLVLIDEMTLGLAPTVINILVEAVRKLRRERGLTFLIVEQNAMTALDIADYTYVMENGRIVFDGDSDRLRSHDDFREFYLGFGMKGEKSFQDVKQYRRKRRWFG